MPINNYDKNVPRCTRFLFYNAVKTKGIVTVYGAAGNVNLYIGFF